MIDYSGKTYKNILKQQMDRVSDQVDKREGSVIMTALGPASWYLEGTYLDLQKMEENIYLPTAVGDALDLIAVAHGLERKKATQALRMGMFNLEIPLDSRFSTVTSGSDKAHVYRTLSLVKVSEGNYLYQMQCETAGEVGNGYIGRLLAVSYVQGLTSAELGEIITAGTDMEKDDDFRDRILQRVRLPSTSGNKYDYYNWAMEVSGVGGTKVFPLADGPGTVKVVIADANMQAAGEALVKEVYDYIEERRPIGATLTVKSAKEKSINVEAMVKLQNGVSLAEAQNRFQTSLSVYMQRNAFQSDYVSLAQIGNLLLNVAGIEDYNNLKLNGLGGNIPLVDEEIAVVGAVRLGVM